LHSGLFHQQISGDIPKITSFMPVKELYQNT
jgi:hypothetical protein